MTQDEVRRIAELPDLLTQAKMSPPGANMVCKN
jgi:hypothetical protein